MGDFINHKILIVDDQQKNIQVLGSLLRLENYIIGVATNGKQALEILIESNDFDLVLMDVNMPIMNGFEACRAIRKNENLKEIPIIFLTALVDTESIVKGFDVGGQDYVTKPFNSKELLARVSTQLELKHNRDKLKQVNKWLEKKVEERTEELNIANGKLLQLDTAKTEFLNIISHEIRTPLNGIVGPLTILNESQLPPDVASMIEALDESAKRLEDFSMKALDISLFNTKGKEALKPTETDIISIISCEIKNLNTKAEEKNIVISQSNEIGPALSLVDREFMSKCFHYIIDNAIEFGHNDSQIIINTTLKKENVVVSIEDEGVPFHEEYLIASIQPFDTKNHIDQNPALSLFLCKLVIEAHDGQIEFFNTQKGAIVKIHLPKII